MSTLVPHSGSARAHNLGIVDNVGAAATQTIACQASSHAIRQQQITPSSVLSSASPPPQTIPTTAPTRHSIRKTTRCFLQRPPRERKFPGKRLQIIPIFSPKTSLRRPPLQCPASSANSAPSVLEAHVNQPRRTDHGVSPPQKLAPAPTHST